MKKRVFIITAMVLVGLAGQAQRSTDMNLVRKTMKQQHSLMTRNDIAPIKATYNVNDNGTLKQYRDDFIYDEYEYYLTQKSTSVMNNGEWQPFTETTYEVDWNYSPIEIITMKWDGNDWMNDTRSTLEYDEIGFVPVIKEEVIEQWIDNNWVNIHKYVYDYEPIVTLIIKDWNGNTWENHYLYTFEGDGLSERTILLQYWQGGAWQNQEKTVITYNASLHEESITIMEWSNASWVNYEQHTYEYDSHGYVSKIYKRAWENGSWSSTNYQDITYTSDGMGNTTEAVVRANGNANQNTDLTLYYNEEATIDYENVHQINMEYTDLTAVNETETTSRFSVYPNPAESSLVIRGEQFQKAEVLDLAGQKVMESTHPTLDMNALSSGAYLLRIQRKDGTVETQKIVVK